MAAIGDYFSGGVADAQVRLLAQALDLAAEQQGTVANGLVEGELDARGAGVEDGDAACCHWVGQPMMLVPPST